MLNVEFSYSRLITFSINSQHLTNWTPCGKNPDLCLELVFCPSYWDVGEQASYDVIQTFLCPFRTFRISRTNRVFYFKMKDL